MVLPAPLDSRPENRPLFGYGTLRDSGFVRNLLEHEVVCENAVLPEWSLVRLDGAAWPSVAPETAGRVEGLLDRALSDEDRHRLGAYEGVLEGLYERHLLVVETAEGRESAWVYRLTESASRRYGTSR